MAQQLQLEIPQAYLLQQFDNPENPSVHERTTAEEIWHDCEGNIDALVSGVGTGGTITGCGRFLRNRQPSIKIIAVEPASSAVLSGRTAGPHSIQGIGAGFIPSLLDRELIDLVLTVTDSEAMEMGRRLAREEGLLCGVSSGAVVHAALHFGMSPNMRGKRIVMMLSSYGERYLSTPMFSSTSNVSARVDGQL